MLLHWNPVETCEEAGTGCLLSVRHSLCGHETEKQPGLGVVTILCMEPPEYPPGKSTQRSSADWVYENGMQEQ